MAFFDHFHVGVVAEMKIGFFEVPRVERVESDVVKTLLGNGTRRMVLQYAVQVIVVTPGKKHLVQSAIRLVNAVLRTIDRVFVIRICFEAVGKNDAAFIESASNGEVVAYDGPLGLSKRVQDFTSVVD